MEKITLHGLQKQIQDNFDTTGRRIDRIVTSVEIQKKETGILTQQQNCKHEHLGVILSGLGNIGGGKCTQCKKEFRGRYDWNYLYSRKLKKMHKNLIKQKTG